MIHWLWLIVAACAGVLATVLILALCAAAGNADERMEQLKRPNKEEGSI